MGRYIMRTGSIGLGSILFTSPKMTGHRHRRILSLPSPAAADELLRNPPRPLQHSLCGVGVSASLPVRNDPQVISAASGVTHSVGDDGEPPPRPPPPPGRPGKPGTKGNPDPADGAALGQGGVNGTPGTGGAGDDGLEIGVVVPGKPDGVGGDGLAPGKPGKMELRGLLEPGRPGKRSASASAPAPSEEAGAAVYLAASDGRAAAAAAAATITVASTTAMQLEVDMDGHCTARHGTASKSVCMG
jgi:hypothetical protein